MIIFLDIDGVVTSARTGWRNMDVYAASFLRWVCEQSGARIVISSTWRYNRDRQFFVNVFGDVIHDDWRTSIDLLTNGTDCRGDEIKLWLDAHNCTEYLILDDDDDMLDYQVPNLILTDSYNGLMWNDMIEIIDRLSIPICNMDVIFQHSNAKYDTGRSDRQRTKGDKKSPKFI